jgi:hypothetical protein
MALSRFAAQLIGIPTQPPECGNAAGDLDRRVEAEPDQRDAAGEEPCDQRDETFDRIPCDGDVLEAAALRGAERKRGRSP